VSGGSIFLSVFVPLQVTEILHNNQSLKSDRIRHLGFGVRIYSFQQLKRMLRMLGDRHCWGL
jgi:hypothetical protein